MLGGRVLTKRAGSVFEYAPSSSSSRRFQYFRGQVNGLPARQLILPLTSQSLNFFFPFFYLITVIILSDVLCLKIAAV
jgi:hypothetical protein